MEIRLTSVHKTIYGKTPAEKRTRFDADQVPHTQNSGGQLGQTILAA